MNEITEKRKKYDTQRERERNIIRSKRGVGERERNVVKITVIF